MKIKIWAKSIFNPMRWIKQDKESKYFVPAQKEQEEYHQKNNLTSGEHKDVLGHHMVSNLIILIKKRDHLCCVLNHLMLQDRNNRHPVSEKKNHRAWIKSKIKVWENQVIKTE